MQELETHQKENYERESEVYLDFIDYGSFLSFSHLLNFAIKDADNSHSPLKLTRNELEFNKVHQSLINALFYRTNSNCGSMWPSTKLSGLHCAPLCRCCGST